MSKFLKFLQNNIWFFCFILFFSFVCIKTITKGYIAGPLDFLVNFYDPYKEIKWQNIDLTINSMHPKNYLMSDVITVTLPIKLLTINLIKKLQFPLWNPYILNGSPLLANVQSAVLYPLNIVYLMFSPITAFNIYVLSQFIFAFIFMFMYLRILRLEKIYSYYGSLSFTFSAFFVVWSGWATLGHALIWLPLAFYIIEDTFENQKMIKSIHFTFALVLSFFAGHTQTTLIVYLLSLSYIFYKSSQTKKLRIGFNLLIYLLISVLIICVQLLPTIEMYTQSVREIVSSNNFYKDQTLYFSSYLMGIIPDFFGNPVTGNWWGKINYAESAIYFGTISFYFLIYQLSSKKYWEKNISNFFIILLISSILISTQNIFSQFIFNLKIPLISSSTFSRYSVIYIFSGVILASFGLKNYFTELQNRNFKKIFNFNYFFIGLIFIYWLLILFKMLPKEYILNLLIIERNSILPTFFLSIILLIPFLLHFFNNKKLAFYIKIAKIIIIFILSIDLFRFTNKYLVFSPPEFFYPNNKLVTTLKKYANSERYNSYFSANINSMYGISTINGSEPLYNKNLGELASLGQTGKINITDRASMQIPDGYYKPRIIDLLSMKYFVDKTDNSRNDWINFYGKNSDFDSRYKEIWTDGIYKIYLNISHLPRQKIFYKVKIINNKNEVLQNLINKKFDYQTTAIVEEKIQIPHNNKGYSSIETIIDKPLIQEYKIITNQPGLFMVTDTYYPGWNVYVDNSLSKIYKTNYAFRGVKINQGTHKIVFKYEPKSFLIGGILSLIGFVILIMFYLKNKSI